MIKLRATPEQIQALNDGEEIVVLARMEPQPTTDGYCGFGDMRLYSWRGHRFSSRSVLPRALRDSCPVAIGDTVEAWCVVCEGSGGFLVRHGGHVAKCHGCKGRPFYRPTVRHIAHREQPDGHFWEVRLSK